MREFDRFLRYYENSEDLNLRDQRRGENRREPLRERSNSRGEERGGRGRERETREPARSYTGGANTTRLFVNLGTKDGFYKSSFLQFVLDMSDLKKEVLGKIDIKEMNSWIEIEKNAAGQMIKAIDGKNYRGRKIRMNDAESGGYRK